jgi:capsule polysaccharide export protein KpsC/LpsZ
MNTHEILKNASAVITINSNTGIEALLYKKPTILLGNVYYDISNMFIKVRDFYDLPKSIKKALKMKFNDDEILKFINALLESTHKGHTLFVRKFNKYLYDAKNIKNIVDGFEKEFKLL